MKNLAKKLCSIITVIALILSAIGMLPAALAATTVNSLELDVPATAYIVSGSSADFYFTPQQDGVYCFYSISAEDTYGVLYNAEEDWLASDDNGGDSENFSINYTLSAGQTYELRAQFSSGNAGYITVAVTTSEIVSLTVQDVSIIENTNGYTETEYNEETNEWDIEWYCYEIPPTVEFTVYFKDGSSISKGQAGAPGISYNDEWYWLNTETDQSYENQWSAGNTYSVTARILGVKTTFNVTIAENPVESVVFENASIIENTNGYTTNAYNEETGEYDLEWFCYFTPNPAFTVNFKDGSSASSDGSSIEYNGNTYSLTIYDNQSYENQWTLGNTYEVVAEILGVKGTFNVTVTNSPIESIVIEPISIIEGSNGYIDSCWDEELGEQVEYFHYYINAKATVEFTDGTVQETTLGSGLDYNGEYYSFSWSDTQQGNPWTVGNTYTVPVTLMKKTVDVSVTITPSPVKSITVEPISIIENSNGYWTGHWDNELKEYVDYYHYSWAFNTIATVEFNDGTISEGCIGFADAIEYNNAYYNFTYSDQQYETPWTVGNTYYVPITFMGKTVDVSVTITPSPIKSLSVEPLFIQEGTHGWWTWDYNQAGDRIDYYLYRWYDYVDITVEFEDGTTGTYGLWDTVSYGDYEWRFNYTHTQNCNNHWTLDNTYTEQVSLCGVTADVNVTITEAPCESIEILSVTPLKETDYYYINENGDAIYSIPHFTYKITFKDGSSLIRDSYWYYEEYQISASHDQYDEPWTVGGENLVTVSIGKVTTTFSAIITEVSDWEYTLQDGKAYITNCGLVMSEITVPDKIDGYTVVGIMSMGDCLNNASVINLPDSVVFLSEEAFEGGYNLDTINVGANISELDPDAFKNCYVYEINVPENNPYFSTVDGIVYNKSGDTLVVYPLGQGSTYYVPDNVVDANVILEKDYYSWITLEFGENCKAFKEVDGITYSGDMTIVISCDPEKTGSYNMPDTVTDIKEFAFSGSKLSSVTVSDNVSELVYNVFSYCNNLETITLPDTLTSIGESAFFESNLKNLTRLPTSLTDIGDNAFAGTNLTSMTIPSSVNTIGNSAFAYSTLEKLTLSEGLETIGYSAFVGTYITSLTIPDSVTAMGDGAFADTPLKTLNVGSGLYEIPRSAFSGTALTTVSLPDNIEYIGAGAFAYSDLSKITFKADEVYIGNRAFAGCPLDKTTLSNNIMGFGQFAFSGNSMTSVKIPDSVTDITYYSFAYSENLASIDIPDTLESVDGHAFDGTAWYEAQADGVVYLENVLYHYKGDIPENTEISVKPGTTVIADYAFEMEYDYFNVLEGSDIIRDVSGLKSVTLPDGVKTIGVYAFYGCINLEKIIMPESVTWISDVAFSGCDNLTIYGYEGSYAQQYANTFNIPFVTMVAKEKEEVKVTAPPEVIDENAELVVAPIEADEIVEALPEEIQHTNIVVFDIYFELDGETVQPNGTVTVEITVPEELSGKHCKVYHIADDGTVTDMNAVFTGGKLVFDTTHFSVYTIVENKPAYTPGDVNEDDKINNRDYALLMQYINKWDVTIVEDAADVNRDGKINNRDYALLMQYINKWDVELQ